MQMQLTDKNASGVRKYFMEYVIMSLVIAVVTLFGLYYNLNQFVMTTVMTDKIHESAIIERNTEALQLLINKNNNK